MTTPNTLAKLAADERTELLDWVSACQSAHLIDSTPGHRFGGLPSSLDDNRELLVVHVESILAERVRALTAQALPAAGRCDECGKDQAEGWALYCVGCLEKTGLLAKEALPSAQHVSSTAADLTGPNNTTAQATTGAATTGAPSEPFGYFKAEPFGWTDCAEDDDGAVALYEGPASQFTGAFSGIAARKLADLADRGYRVNGYSLMHAETRARGFIDSGGFVGWWSNRDHEQAALATAGWREQHDRDSAELRSLCQARDVARQQRDHARGCYDSAVKLLTGIHALLYPAPITVPDGRTMVFRPKDPGPHAVLQELSDRIRALPDALAALPQPPQPQSAQTKGDAA